MFREEQGYELPGAGRCESSPRGQESGLTCKIARSWVSSLDVQVRVTDRDQGTDPSNILRDLGQ